MLLDYLFIKCNLVHLEIYWFVNLWIKYRPPNFKLRLFLVKNLAVYPNWCALNSLAMICLLFSVKTDGSYSCFDVFEQRLQSILCFLCELKWNILLPILCIFLKYNLWWAFLNCFFTWSDKESVAHCYIQHQLHQRPFPWEIFQWQVCSSSG